MGAVDSMKELQIFKCCQIALDAIVVSDVCQRTVVFGFAICNRDSVPEYRTTIWTNEPAQHSQQSCFASTVRSANIDDFPGQCLKIQIPKQ